MWIKNRNLIKDCNVYLVDIHCYINRRIKDIPNLKYCIAAASKLPFENEMFDIIILKDVIYLLNNLNDVLRELFRVLKKKGKIYISFYGDNHLVELYQLLQICNIKPLYNSSFLLKEKSIKKYLENNVIISSRVEYKDKFLISNLNDAFRYVLSYAKCDENMQKTSENLRNAIKEHVDENNSISFTKEHIVIVCEKTLIISNN